MRPLKHMIQDHNARWLTCNVVDGKLLHYVNGKFPMTVATYGSLAYWTLIGYIDETLKI